MVFSLVNSDFELAKDMIVLHEHKSSLFGLNNKDRKIMQNVPHTLTLNDTLVLQMFF